MLTASEKLHHEIELLEKESQELKNNHVWGDWENWKAFVIIDIKIIDLQKKVLELERQDLIESFVSYKKY